MPPRHAGGSEGQLRPSSSSSWAKLGAAGGRGGEDTSPPAPALLPPAPPGAPSRAPQTSPGQQPPKLATKAGNNPPNHHHGDKTQRGEALPQPTPLPNWPHPSGASPPPQIQQPGHEVPLGAATRTRLSRQPPRSSPRSSRTLGSRHEPGSERASEGELLAAPRRQPDFPFPLRETQPLPQRGRWGSAEQLGGRPAPASTEASPPHVDGAGGHAAAPGCSWRCRRAAGHLVPEPTRGEKRVAESHGEIWGSAGPRRTGCRFLHPAGRSGTEAAAPCAYAPCTPLFFLLFQGQLVSIPFSGRLLIKEARLRLLAALLRAG